MKEKVLSRFRLIQANFVLLTLVLVTSYLPTYQAANVYNRSEPPNRALTQFSNNTNTNLKSTNVTISKNNTIANIHSNSTILNYQVMYPTVAQYFLETIFTSQAHNYREYIDAPGVELNYKYNSYIPQAGVSANELIVAIKQNASAFIVDGYFSTITLATDPILTSLVMPHLTISSTPDLKDKSAYPVELGMTQFIDKRFGKFAHVVNKFGWKRVALITERSTFGRDMADGFKQVGKELDLRIFEGKYEPHIGFSSKNRNLAKTMLLQLKMQQVYVYVVGGSNEDSAYIFEMAEELEMLGNEKYVWFDKGTVLDRPENGYNFTRPYSELMTGVFSLFSPCYTSSLEYERFVRNSGNKKDVYTSPYGCIFHDIGAATLKAANQTLWFMHQKNIDYRCLEHQYFIDYPEKCSSSAITAPVLDHIRSRTSCTELAQCKYCGVCEMLKKFGTGGLLESLPLNVFQLLQLLELYSLDFLGASGTVSFENDGGRDGDRIETSIFNYQNGSFLDIGSVDFENETINFEIFPVFANNVTTIPSDFPEEEVVERSSVTRILWCTSASVGILCCFIFGNCFYHKRELLIIKTSSPTIMYTMLLGSFFGFSSIIVLNAWPYLTNTSCILNEWLLNLGWALTFGSIIAKMYQIKTVFCDLPPTPRAIKLVETKYLFCYIALFALFISIYLGFWTGFGSLGNDQFVEELPTVSLIHYKCKKNAWLYALVGLELFVSLCAALLAFSVYKVPEYFNLTRISCIVVYNWVAVLTITQIFLYIFSDSHVDTHVSIECFARIINFGICIGTFFGQRLFLAYTGRGEERHKVQVPTIKEKPTKQSNVSCAGPLCLDQVSGKALGDTQTVEMLNSNSDSSFLDCSMIRMQEKIPTKKNAVVPR